MYKEFMGYKIPSCEIQKEIVKYMGCHIKSSMHCKGIECAGCVAQPSNNVVEQYLKQKEQEMKNEMPNLEAGMVVEDKQGDQYVYVHKELSIGVGARCCGWIFNPRPLSTIVKIYRDVSRNLSSPQTEELLWTRESSTDKAIRELEEQKAKSDAEFEEKLSKLKETLK